MTTKQSALEKLESLKPEPKKRRTAQEQALAPLLKRYQALREQRERAFAKIAEKFDDEIARLGQAIHALGGDATKPLIISDEQAPESE